MNKKIKIIEWKPIKEFDGYYINKTGQVKSIRSFKGTKEKILKGSKNQQGYKTITMIKNGKVYTKTLHRLLAKVFIPNPNKYPCINHIDGNKLNNIVDNLEWCTASENTKHAYKYGLEKIYKGIENCHYGKKSHKRKKVYQYTLDNRLLKVWDCAGDVNNVLGINIGNIASCCRGERNKAGGYKWRYKLRKENNNGKRRK